MTFNLKKNDTEPTIQAMLMTDDGSPVDLSVASVRFHMRNSSGTVVIDEPATIINGSAGIVQYDWTATETETSGLFEAEFEVTYSSGGIETFPNVGYEEIVITDDIA